MGHLRQGKSLLVLAALFVCAMALAACGDDEDGTTSTLQGGSTSSSPGPSDPAGGAPEGTEKDLPSRGTVSPQSADFQKYSSKGKLHLAEFGDEASDGDRSAVQAVVEPYLEALAQDDWDEACAYLLAETRAQLTQPAASQGTDDACDKALPVAIASFETQAGQTPVLAPEGVASLRIEKGGRAGDGAGFALFHSSDGESRWLAVKVEDGGWKILSIAPQPFR